MVENDGYQNLKKAVLDCYRTFWTLLNDSEVKFLLDDTSLVKLQNQARRIRTNQFSTMATEEERKKASAEQTLILSDRKAQYLALADFVQNMNRVYEECEVKLKNEMEQKTIKNKKTLRSCLKKIDELQAEIIDMDDRMHEVLDEITYEYMDNIGKLEKEGEDILQKYKEEVEKINEKGSSALERLKRFKKLSLCQVDIFRDCQSRLQNELRIDRDNTLGVKSQTIALQNELIQAYFEKVKDLIEKEGVYTRQFILVKSAKTTGSIISKILGSDNGNVSILDACEQLKKFDEDNYKLTKKSIIEIVEKIKGDLISKIWLAVKNISKSYKKEIEKDIEVKKMELLLMKREQLIMLIERNRNDLLDYQTMINEALKLVRTTQVE